MYLTRDQALERHTGVINLSSALEQRFLRQLSPLSMISHSVGCIVKHKYANLIVMLIPRQSHWARRAAKLIFPGENKRARASCLIEVALLMDWKVMA